MKKLGLAALAIALLLAAGQTAHAITISSGDILEVIYNPGGLEYIANIGPSSALITAATGSGGVTTVAPLVPGGGIASGITPQTVFGAGNLEGLTIAFVSWDQASPRTLELSLGSGAFVPPSPIDRSTLVGALNNWRTLLTTDPDGNPVDENYNNVSDQPRSVDGVFSLAFGSLGGLLSGGIIETTIPTGGLDQLDFYHSATAVSGGAWQNIGYFSFDPSTGVTQFHVPVEGVPEPASLLLLGSGVTALFVSRRKTRKG